MAVKALYEKVKVKMARGLSGFGEIKLCHGASENGTVAARDLSITVRTKFLFRPLQNFNFCNFTTTRRLLL